MNKTNFPLLFKPLRFGKLVSKNRLLSAPMGAGATLEGEFVRDGMRFFEDLARGGVGIVCIGETMVHSATGNDHGTVLRMDDPKFIPKMRECTRGIHRYGALASIELLHPGRRADPKFNAEGKTYGPTGGMTHFGDGEHYTTELTQEMIDMLVNAFGDAAEMAKVGGCDMCTVQGAHGWLLAQFLSPNTNKRTDKYGGCIENRARIYLEVAQNIRKKCGPDFGIDFRISGCDFMENGATEEDVIRLAELLDPYVDMLHISAASFDNKRASQRMFPVMFLPRGCNSYLAVEIRKHVHVPVITVGGFGDPVQMEQMLEEDMVDGFALGRELLADPMMPEKARTGREDDIMLCTRCEECMSMDFVPYVRYPMGKAMCAVNPFGEPCDFYYDRVIRRGDHNVLVVGAGPAGMEAALGAAMCGHHVTLAEKSGSFGGTLKCAWDTSFKKDIKRFVEVLGRRIERNPNIKVEFNTTVTPEYIEKMQPDDVIIAIGADPVRLDIPGARSPKVILGTQIHEHELGQKVLFIGGGMVGLEEGIEAAYSGRQVTVLEATDKLCTNAPYIHFLGIQMEMEKLPNMKVMTGTAVTAITEEGVKAVKDGVELLIEADSVVMCTGMKSRSEEAWALYDVSANAMIVGDAKKPARMNEAVTDGFFAGLNLERFDQGFDR